MICNVPVCDSDITKPKVITPTGTTIGNEYAGTSDKNKPENVPQYSIYFELDTGKFYYYDNGKWSEIPQCGSGGGGDDPKPEGVYIKLENSGTLDLTNVLIGSADEDQSMADLIQSEFLVECGEDLYCFKSYDMLIGDTIYFKSGLDRETFSVMGYTDDEPINPDWCKPVVGTPCSYFVLNKNTYFIVKGEDK